MKIRAIVILVFLLNLLSVAESAVYYYVITPEELKQRIDNPEDNNFLLIDVRKESEYDAAHIPGAICIPLKELGYRLWNLEKSKDIIVYCKEDKSSKVAAQVLINAGFKDVYDLSGGLKNWEYSIETENGRIEI